jgi:hypothetical protein
VQGSCECGNKPSGFIKVGKFCVAAHLTGSRKGLSTMEVVDRSVTQSVS